MNLYLFEVVASQLIRLCLLLQAGESLLFQIQKILPDYSNHSYLFFFFSILKSTYPSSLRIRIFALSFKFLLLKNQNSLAHDFDTKICNSFTEKQNMSPFNLLINIKMKYANQLGGEHFFCQVGGCKKILGKKIGTLKTGGGKKIDPLARIYTPASTFNDICFKNILLDLEVQRF